MRFDNMLVAQNKLSVSLRFSVETFKITIFLQFTPIGIIKGGNTEGGSITVPLTSCLTGLESAV